MDLSNSSSTTDTQSSEEKPTSTLPASPVSPTSPTTIPTSLPLPSNKIYSQNANGTMVMTTIPNNDAELQLYRVMQRASLLMYYDTLLEMGGDDVQQLCDAGEEEFLEIMALVGMASKPLHVRRFQKSLQEWMIDPSAFQVPLDRASANSAVECSSRRSILDPGSGSRILYSPGSSGSRSSSPAAADAVLSDAQVSRLRAAAELLASRLPRPAPRPPAKRRASRELDAVLAMADSDPRRMDAIRRYAAIYGRWDCKRRPERPLSLHEASVNEAAAHLCSFLPALLTRRDELFPLARQVVRDAGYTHSISIPTTTKSCSSDRCERTGEGDTENEDEPPAKKPLYIMESILAYIANKMNMLKSNFSTSIETENIY